MRSSAFRPLVRTATRTLTTSTRRQYAFRPMPAPPSLPKEEQDLFERL